MANVAEGLPHSASCEFGAIENLQEYSKEMLFLKMKLGEGYLQGLKFVKVEKIDFIKPEMLSSSVMRVEAKDNFILALKLTHKVSGETFALCFARGMVKWEQFGAPKYTVFSEEGKFPEHLKTLTALVKGTHEQFQLAG